jgi:hypothetical protein
MSAYSTVHTLLHKYDFVLTVQCTDCTVPANNICYVRNSRKIVCSVKCPVMEFSGNQPWILLQKNNLLKYSPEFINTVLTVQRHTGVQ